MLELKNIEPERQSVWLPFGKPEEGAKLLIGYSRAAEFQRAAGKLTNKSLQQTKGRKLENDAIRNINRNAAVGTLLLDFEGFTVAGKELPKATPEEKRKSIQVLLANELVYEFVMEESSNLANFRNDDPAAPITEGDTAAMAESKSGATTPVKVAG